MAPLVGVPEEIAKDQFITGLKEDIRAEVGLLGPRSLDHAVDLFIKVEVKLRSGLNLYGAGNRAIPISSYSGNSSFKNHSSSYGPSTRTASVLSHSCSSPSRGIEPLPVARPVGEVKRFSEKELQSKREEGECFRCNEKWSAGHRCRKKELSVISIKGMTWEMSMNKLIK